MCEGYFESQEQRPGASGAGYVEATAEQIAVWLRKEDEEGFQRCPDIVLSSFLNGLIYEKRGKDEPPHWSLYLIK